MRDDAASGLVDVDDRRVDESFRNDSGLDDRIDNEFEDPIRYRIDFSFRIKFLVSGSALFHLISVDVTFAKKVSENQDILFQKFSK